jgi:hypothetical protein
MPRKINPKNKGINRRFSVELGSLYGKRKYPKTSNNVGVIKKNVITLFSEKFILFIMVNRSL